VQIDKETRVVSLCVELTGTLHAVVVRDGHVHYLSNEEGEPRREMMDEAGERDRGVIVTDTHGDVHIVCADGGARGVQYWRRTQGAWSKALLAEGEGLGEHLSLAIDSMARPHVLYSSPAGLIYMGRTSAGPWVRHAVTDGPIAGCGLVVDTHGVVHLCFADRTRAMMMYATSGQPVGNTGR
jgi:hypothetical protein